MQRGKFGARGWVWVTLITLILSAFVWQVRRQSGSSSPSYGGRSYAVAAASAKAQFGEDRNPATSIFNADLAPPESTWIDYRSRASSTSLKPTIEPKASVALMAPKPEVSKMSG